MEHPAVASLSLASILENSVTQPQISEWLSSPPRDFQARLLSRLRPSPDGLHLSHFYGSSPPKSPPSQHSSSSMAPACIHQPSTASTCPPSLYNYSEATPTETSISTGLASRFSGGVPLLDDNNGVLERRENNVPRPVFECSFWFLNCSYLSDNQEEWREHCLSHFRGEEPPKSVKCPLCDDFKYTSESGSYSWSLRMDHVAYHHSVLGETLRASRPDFSLFQHLWQKQLIDDADLKELKGGNHNLTRQQNNFVVTNGRRGRDGRGGRGERYQHIGVSASVRRGAQRLAA